MQLLAYYEARRLPSGAYAGSQTLPRAVYSLPILEPFGLIPKPTLTVHDLCSLSLDLSHRSATVMGPSTNYLSYTKTHCF
jgi:hypothetical protein